MERLTIEYVDINSVRPYKGNAKLHPREQIDQIKKSIEQFGMDDPIGVWKDEIVEGHGRLIACQELGYTEIPIIRLDHLTDEERKAYTLAHNKLTMNSDFDLEILNEELMKFETIDMGAFGFDISTNLDDIDDLIEDEPPEAPKEPKTKPGEVYQLGIHRLMCGDSTNKKDVEKLMDGELADLVVTDPPYNVAIENSQGMKIQNDNMAEKQFQEFLTKAFECMSAALRPGGAFYVWFASRNHINFETALNENDLEVRQELIWNKSSLILGRQDYQWKHEPCLYGWKDGEAHYFIDDRKQTTVIEDKRPDIKKMKKEEMRELLEKIFSDKISSTVINEDKPNVNDLHPTMKPIKLIARQIKNSSKMGWKVLDLFGGSGSTLITCEQLNRKCYMMEYDPVYMDVIIERWEAFTGKKAELIQEQEDRRNERDRKS